MPEPLLIVVCNWIDQELGVFQQQPARGFGQQLARDVDRHVAHRTILEQRAEQNSGLYGASAPQLRDRSPFWNVVRDFWGVGEEEVRFRRVMDVLWKV